MNKKSKKIILWSFISCAIVASVGTTIGIVLRDYFENLKEKNKYLLENSIWKFENKNKIQLYIRITEDIKDMKLDINDFIVEDQWGNIMDIDASNSIIDIKNDNIVLSLKGIDNKSKKFVIKNKKYNDFKISIDKVKTFNYENQNEKLKYFKNCLKDMSSNNIPSIIQIRNASLPVQQAFYISLVNYFNNGGNYDQSILLFGEEVISQNRFNENVLINNNICKGYEKLENINNTNNKLYLLRNEEINRIDGLETKVWLKYYSNIFKKFNYANKKVDFVIDDLDFLDMIEEYTINYKNSKLDFILKHANRILIITDGNAHVNSVIPKLYNLMSNVKVRSNDENIKTLEEYQKGKINNLSQNDLMNLLLIKNYESSKGKSDFNFIDFINFDSNIKNSLNLDDDQFWNEINFSTNFVDYGDIVDNKEEFLDIFSKLFMDSNLNMESLFVNGLNSYDPNKRNAIFIGSSLFLPFGGVSSMSENDFSRLQSLPNLRKVIQDKMKSFLEKYPPSEYNIIFKLHPAFSKSFDTKNQIAINYVNLITNGLIKDPIILSPSIPLETLISNDYYIYSNGGGSKNRITNFIFKENEKYKPYEWTTFFGLQASTTAIMTTRIFYQNTFNLTKYQSAEIVPFSNFGIPKEYRLTKRIDEDINSSTNWYNDNVEVIKNLYSPYNPSLFYSTKELEEYDSIVLNF